jgi:hypothetical protein
MKALIATIAFTAGLATAAVAQSWQSMDQRRADLDQRIDAGVSEGQITREEAARLREDFRQIVALQQRYRINGLNAQERRELDQRFERLSNQINAERHDREANLEGAGASMERRLAMTQQRISEGEQGGALNASETVRLRAETRELAGLQVRLSAGGLTVQERSELDRRFDALDEKIRRSETRRFATAAARR